MNKLQYFRQTLHLNTKGDTNSCWLHNKRIWGLLQIFLKKNWRSCVTKKRHQYGIDQFYDIFTLLKSVENSTADRPEWIDSSRLLFY